MATVTAPEAPSAELPASSWSAQLAGLKSRGVSDQDSRVRRCRAALAFHRTLRVVDAEADRLDPADAAALAARLTGGA